jgi:hypothetical protein
MTFLSNVVTRTVSLGCWGGVETDLIPPAPCALYPRPPPRVRPSFQPIRRF